MNGLMFDDDDDHVLTFTCYICIANCIATCDTRPSTPKLFKDTQHTSYAHFLKCPLPMYIKIKRTCTYMGIIFNENRNCLKTLNAFLLIIAITYKNLFN